MSSKVLGPGEVQATPVAWRRLSGGEPAADPAPGVRVTPPAEDVLELERRLAELRASIEARETAARQAGLNEGAERARREIEAPVAKALEKLSAEIEALADYKPHFRRDAEHELVKLAVEIARRVLRREVAADPSAILGLVKAALERVEAREVLKVRIYPAYAPLVRQFLDSQSLPQRVEVAEDPTLEPGGVMLETTRGVIDASIETQLGEIDRGLTDVVRRSH